MSENGSPLQSLTAFLFCESFSNSYLSETEINQLIDAPASSGKAHRDALALRDRAVCETFYAGALRVSELISARVHGLDLQNGLLLVLGKGSKERVAPLGRRATDALKAYLHTGRPDLEQGKGSPYLFIGRRGDSLTRQAVNCLLKERAKRASLSHVHPHQLRHSTATHMLNRGADLRTIQTVLGHSDISTTEIYTHASQEHVKNIWLTCHPRNNPKRAQMGLFQLPALPEEKRIICTDCPGPAAPGKTRCEQHVRLGNAASLRSYYRKHVSKGPERFPAVGVGLDECVAELQALKK